MEAESKIHRTFAGKVRHIALGAIIAIVWLAVVTVVGGILEGFVYWVLHYKF